MSLIMTVVKKDGFDLHTFIVQSCLIDQQYNDRDYPTQLFLADKPGQLMYDNTAKAFELMTQLVEEPFYGELPKDLHRTLTKDIRWYEDRELSGRYRTEELTVGSHDCPKFMFVDFLMRERWAPRVLQDLESFDGTPEHALKIAWAIHHSFEYIHPFADGNGRTGRLLLNYALLRMKQEPMVIWYKDRFSYYNSIEKFNTKIDEYLNLKGDYPI